MPLELVQKTVKLFANIFSALKNRSPQAFFRRNDPTVLTFEEFKDFLGDEDLTLSLAKYMIEAPTEWYGENANYTHKKPEEVVRESIARKLGKKANSEEVTKALQKKAMRYVGAYTWKQMYFSQ